MFWKTLPVLLKDALASTRRTNAVQPITWLCAVVTLPCFFFAYKAPDLWLKASFLAIGVIPVVLFVRVYLFFMHNDRDRLHSEDFQLKSRSLSTVEAKGGSVEILPVELGTVDPATRTREITGQGDDGGDHE